LLQEINHGKRKPVLEANRQTPYAFLSRHACGNWGDLCEADRQENARALRQGGRLMSTYTLKNGQTLWIITEADRSVTTLLLPLEY
jgi:hypothetical protein